MEISENIVNKLGKELIISIHRNISSTPCGWSDFSISIFMHRIVGEAFEIKYRLNSEQTFTFWLQYKTTGVLDKFEFEHRPWNAENVSTAFTTDKELPSKIKSWILDIHRRNSENSLWERIITNNYYNPEEGIKINGDRLDGNELDVLSRKIDELKQDVNGTIFSTMGLTLEAMAELQNTLDEIKSTIEKPSFTKKDIHENLMGKLISKVKEHATDKAFCYSIGVILKELVDIFEKSEQKGLASSIQILLPS